MYDLSPSKEWLNSMNFKDCGKGWLTAVSTVMVKGGWTRYCGWRWLGSIMWLRVVVQIINLVMVVKRY